MDIMDALKKAFETGGNASTFQYNGTMYTIHTEMSATEVLEILQMNIPLTELQFGMVKESAEKQIEANQNTEASGPEFKSLGEEIEYELDLYSGWTDTQTTRLDMDTIRTLNQQWQEEDKNPTDEE